MGCEPPWSFRPSVALRSSAWRCRHPRIVQDQMSCRDEPAGYLVLEQQCPRLTPVVSVPWKAICGTDTTVSTGALNVPRRPPRSASILMTHFVAGSCAGRCDLFWMISQEWFRGVDCAMRPVVLGPTTNHRRSLPTACRPEQRRRLTARSRHDRRPEDDSAGRTARKVGWPPSAQVYSDFFQPVFQRGPLAARDSGDDDADAG